MNNDNKKGFLHPFISYLISNNQLEIIIDDCSESHSADLEQENK